MSSTSTRQHKVKDIAGMRFGKLLVIDQANPFYQRTGAKRAVWRCRCDCGKTTVVRGTDLRAGKQKTCGCGRGRPRKISA
jgi:hypothetical protein